MYKGFVTDYKFDFLCLCATVDENSRWKPEPATGWNSKIGVKTPYDNFDIMQSLPYDAKNNIIGNSPKSIIRESYDWSFGTTPKSSSSGKEFRQTNAMSRGQVSNSKTPSAIARAQYGSITAQQQSALNNSTQQFANACSSLYNVNPRYKSINPHEHVSRIGVNGLQLLDTCLQPIESMNPMIARVGRITNPNFLTKTVENHVLPMMDTFAIMYVYVILC